MVTIHAQHCIHCGEEIDEPCRCADAQADLQDAADFRLELERDINLLTGE